MRFNLCNFQTRPRSPLTISVAIFETSHHRVSFCHRAAPLGWSTYGTMSMQIGWHSATFVSTSLGTPSREEAGSSSFAEAIKVHPSCFQIFTKRRESLSNAFLLLVISLASHTSTLFSPLFFFTTSDATFLLRYISIEVARSFFFVFHRELPFHRSDQTFCPSMCLYNWKRFLRAKVETSRELHSYAYSYFGYFILLWPRARARVSQEISLDNSKLKRSFRLVSRKANYALRRVTTVAAVQNLANFWQRPSRAAFGNAYVARYSPKHQIRNNGNLLKHPMHTDSFWSPAQSLDQRLYASNAVELDSRTILEWSSSIAPQLVGHAM